jgi:hypothetical protein
MPEFNMVLLIKEVICHLIYILNTLLISSGGCYPLASGSSPSGKMESVKLTLFRLFSELDLTTPNLGGSPIPLLFWIDSK